LILIITNPTTSRFKEYLNSKGFITESYKYEYLSENEEGKEVKLMTTQNFTFGKENNYFVFSIFKYEDNKYVGILGNFYKK